MKKILFYTLFFGWMAFICVTAMVAMSVMAIVLGEHIPDGTPLLVRLAIGVPCLMAAPMTVLFVLITISRWLDRKNLLGLH